MSRKPVLQVVVASTRPERAGPAVAEWFAEQARRHGGFDVEVVDLADVNLPMFDEPHHPRLRNYVHDHTKRWSATVDRADAFVFVTPEYNHSFPASLKNAIDYLHHEWQRKPIGFVSYGGVSAGTRAMQALKPVAAALKMVPVTEAVNLPFFQQYLTDGAFAPGQLSDQAAAAMLDELTVMTGALRELRAAAAETRAA